MQPFLLIVELILNSSSTSMEYFLILLGSTKGCKRNKTFRNLINTFPKSVSLKKKKKIPNAYTENCKPVNWLVGHTQAPSPAYCYSLCRSSRGTFAYTHRKRPVYTRWRSMYTTHTYILTHTHMFPLLLFLVFLMCVYRGGIGVHLTVVYDMLTFACNSMSLLFSFCLPVTSS